MAAIPELLSEQAKSGLAWQDIAMAERWEPDFLGPGFFARTFSLPDDDEGAVVTTVVRYRPETSNVEAGKADRARADVAQNSPEKIADSRVAQHSAGENTDLSVAAHSSEKTAAPDAAPHLPGENAGPGVERERSVERKRAVEGEPDTEQKRTDQPKHAAEGEPDTEQKRGTERKRGAEVGRSPEPEGRKTNPRNPAFAFLAVHGWNDYFYQTELARYVDSIGGAFYAVDLRKYGRSLREGQTFGYIRDFDEYDDELHICRDLIYGELGPKIPLVLYGHSTGGLACALWADRHPGAADGLVLNSPWLEYHGSTGMRQAGAPVVEILARTSPTFVLPTAEDDFYQRALTAWRPDPDAEAVPGHEGSDDPFWTTGWNPKPEFRTGSGAPVRPGWLSAVLNGHARVAAGLDVGCPILVLTSARSLTGNTWSEDFRAVDSVLDVKQIWKRVPELGSHTTLVKLDDAVHDVTFSRREVRERAFEEIGRFLRAYVTDPARM